LIDLSVVVVSWNTRALTLAGLDATARLLGASRLAGELVVVDNGSRDGTAREVRRRLPGARLIERAENGGFARGANAGLGAARGRHVLLLNSDARPLPGALETCVDFLDAHADVGIVGPRLLRPDGRRERSAHAPPGLWSELVPPALAGLAWRGAPPWRSEPARPRGVPALRGAALFVRAAAVRQVGPLPEDYFFFLEETDWCTRMRRAGWRVVQHPGAAVLHVSGASSKRPHPAASRIEYHRSLYRYYGLHRGRAAAAGVRVLRCAKAAARAAAGAPLAWLSARRRLRWRSQCAVLRWHLRGCPAQAGLRALR
jgi:N-acetylglucosaminyl-diphospho-decaprenol L-rhamnosyltransferase